MEADRLPRKEPRPADYETGVAKLGEGEPYGPEVAAALERALSKEREAVQAGPAEEEDSVDKAVVLQDELNAASKAIVQSQVWGPDSIQANQPDFHGLVNEAVISSSDQPVYGD